MLDLADELPAGDQRTVTLKPGQTVKVFTGSRLPRGAEAVVMKEYVTLEDGRAAIAWKVAAGDHIRRVGEEYRRGDVILPAGIRVTPPVVGMLVMLGKDRVAVRRRPSVTVITMGDELVAPGTRPGPGQIPDSNGPAVVAALKSLGVAKVRHRRVKDRLPSLVRAMKDGLEKSDLVITVGGASVGDYDFVHEARARTGRARSVHQGGHQARQAQPLRPGRRQDSRVRAARQPGFRPGLFPPAGQAGGVENDGGSRRRIPRLAGALERRVRQTTRPLESGCAAAWILDDDQLTAHLLTGQGSHMLSGLALADVLVEIPAEAAGAKAGDKVRAVKLDWEK